MLFSLPPYLQKRATWLRSGSCTAQGIRPMLCISLSVHGGWGARRLLQLRTTLGPKGTSILGYWLSTGRLLLSTILNIVSLEKLISDPRLFRWFQPCTHASSDAGSPPASSNASSTPAPLDTGSINIDIRRAVLRVEKSVWHVFSHVSDWQREGLS